MNQQLVLIDTSNNYRNDSLYYRHVLGMTFNKLSPWEWENQRYFRHLKSYEDCMTLGIL